MMLRGMVSKTVAPKMMIMIATRLAGRINCMILETSKEENLLQMIKS